MSFNFGKFDEVAVTQDNQNDIKQETKTVKEDKPIKEETKAVKEESEQETMDIFQQTEKDIEELAKKKKPTKDKTDVTSKKKSSKSKSKTQSKAKKEEKIIYAGERRVIAYNREVYVEKDPEASLEDIRNKLVTTYKYTEFSDPSNCRMYFNAKEGTVYPLLDLKSKG